MALVIKHNLAGDHVATMATGKLLGRSTAGTGAVEEITTATLLAPYPLYTEGTFTFTDASGAGLSLTTETALYVKIGRLVWFSCGAITYPATASGAQAILGGLPFTVYNATTSYHGVRPGFHTLGVKEPGGLILLNTTTMPLYENNNGTALTNAEMSGQTLNGLTGCYLANA